MHPFFFGSSSRPLLGLFHPPVAAPRDRAVLICHPQGQEYVRAYRAMRQLAGNLAAAGFPVLRFDYSCTGDSAGAGEEATLDMWREDVHLACEELLAMGGAPRLAILGLRLGAALALEAAGSREDVDALLLWDPVVDGRDYLAAARRLHRDMLADMDRFPRSKLDEPGAEHEQLLGFPLPDALATGIENLDLGSATPPFAGRSLLLVSGSDAGTAALASRLESASSCELREIAFAAGWTDSAKLETVLLPHEQIGVMVDWMKGGRS